MDWQPIATAPKDGTAFLGWSPYGKWMQLFSWTPGYRGSYWASETCMGVTWDRNHQPTHWMPLPDPPTTETEP